MSWVNYVWDFIKKLGIFGYFCYFLLIYNWLYGFLELLNAFCDCKELFINFGGCWFCPTVD